MRELTLNEMEEVYGGPLPILAAMYSLSTATAVRSLAGFVLNRGFSIYAVYSAAEAYNPH